MIIFGFILGTLFGALSVNLFLKDEKETNELLKRTINNLKEDLDLANSKITDLENNIELLKNNLPKKYKELVDLPKSN